MSDPTWPAALPQISLMSGYFEEPEDNVIRSKTDAGPGKARRRYTAVAVPSVMSCILTTDQVATFITWWRDTVFDGSIPFQQAHHRTGLTARYLPTAPYRIAREDDGYLLTIPVKELP